MLVRLRLQLWLCGKRAAIRARLLPWLWRVRNALMRLPLGFRWRSRVYFAGQAIERRMGRPDFDYVTLLLRLKAATRP